MMSLGLDMSGGMQLATEYRDADTLGATPPRSQVEVTEVSEQAPRSETSTAIDVDDDRWLLFRFHEPYLEILGDVIEFGSKIYWSLGHDANPETTSCSTDTAEGQGGRLEETESDQARRCRTTCLNTMSFWTQAGSCVFLLQQHSTATLPAGISLVKSSAVFSTAVLHLKLASFAAPQVFVGVFFLSAACRAWRFHAAATLEDDCQTQRSFAAVQGSAKARRQKCYFAESHMRRARSGSSGAGLHLVLGALVASCGIKFHTSSSCPSVVSYSRSPCTHPLRWQACRQTKNALHGGRHGVRHSQRCVPPPWRGAPFQCTAGCIRDKRFDHGNLHLRASHHRCQGLLEYQL
eukprot:TRINITY_DN65351_c0_g1_i2.p1 TRINITY_DN65351_c0_g1~~TRINITY_DN65351_c0_g1_i2.p1  ORF type:complete len:349 (+),score=19.53 TRINITY_DN65351_c0_g1_i2:122-1168(+)